MLTYSIPEFAKEIGASKDAIYILVNLGEIKTISFGTVGKKISIYEAKRFLEENAGRDFSNLIKDAKKRKQLEKINRNVIAMKEEANQHALGS